MSERKIDLGYFGVRSLLEYGWYQNYQSSRDEDDDEDNDALNGDEIVSTKHLAIVTITYPLSEAVMFKKKSKTGFTRESIAMLGAWCYKKIYKTQERQGSSIVIAHDIADLVLHTAYIEDFDDYCTVRYNLDS